MKKVGGGRGLYSNEMAQIKYDKNQEINSLYTHPKISQKINTHDIFLSKPIRTNQFNACKTF